MMISLLQLTTLALVATSGVNAADEKYVLRGSAGSTPLVGSAAKGGLTIFSALQASCADGMKDGQQSVRQSWKRNGSDCVDAWSIDDTGKQIKRRNYPENPRDWKQKSYNQCARKGVDAMVEQIKKECLNDSTDQCEDLGEAAAEGIVFENVCIPMFDSQAAGNKKPNYKKTCKKVARGICKGDISRKIKKYCPDDKVNANKLERLMGKCKSEINSLVDGADELESSS